MMVIVDYGVGNLASIKNMFHKIGVEAIISSSNDQLVAATKIILPGVGAFDTCVEKLQESGLKDVLHRKVVIENTPVLGICVGMQLLLEGSEEGKLSGLGWIKGKNVRFKESELPSGYKIPNMGWLNVSLKKKSYLTENLPNEPRFYFVHSYYAQIDNCEEILLEGTYGINFAVGVVRKNIFGVQFHPEKSHKFGMKLLGNFASY